MSESQTPLPPARRRRFAPLMIVAGLASAVLLSLSMTGTLSAFVATITNSVNTAATGTVILQETGPGGTPVVCTSNSAVGGTGNGANTINTNSYTCSGINKYGGNVVMVPGTSVSTTVTFQNIGTAAAATLTLAPGTCVPGNNGAINGSGNLCTTLQVGITANGTAVTGTPATPATLPASMVLPVPAANAASTVTVVFTVTLPASATNTSQGLSATQPLVFTLST